MEKTLKRSEGKEQRLDKWLRERYPELSNRQIDEALLHRLVIGPKNETLKKGEPLFGIPNTGALDTHLQNLWLGNKKIEKIEVLYEENDFTVIDKPAGTASHPLGLFDFDTVTNWALAKYPQLKAEFKDTVQPTLCPHRLDTDTSGLLIVCLKQKAFEEWRAIFHEKKVLKTYLAWCWGKPEKEHWTVENVISHDKKDRSRMVGMVNARTAHRPPILSAKTSFRIVKCKDDRFLVEAQMRTGVTHQVRVHLAMMGYPLVGDKKYDSMWETRKSNADHHLLRACGLSIETKKGEPLVFKSSTASFEKLYT